MPVTSLFRRAALAHLLAAAPVVAWAQAPQGPPAVGTTTVQPQEITETDEFVGRIQSINRVALVARVTGYLTKQLFTEGSEVKIGDLLYQIEKPPFEADVQAKQAAVAQMSAQLQNATITLNRAQALINTPAGQKSTVDDAVASQRSYAAQLLAAQANLRTSEINLGYTDITAPISGKISRTNITIGNVVSPSSGTLATIVSQDPMYVNFPVAVRAALELRDKYQDKGGAKAVVIKLRLPDGHIYGQDGHVDYINPTVATNTDTIDLRGVIANPYFPGAKPGTPGDRTLLDGEFVTVLLEGAEPVKTLAIPQAAVMSDQQGNYVYVVGPDNVAQRRSVTLGQNAGPLSTVSAGLKAGEVIVSDGLQRVRPGQPVAPAPAQPGPGGANGPPGGVPASGSGNPPSASSPQGGAAQGSK